MIRKGVGVALPGSGKHKLIASIWICADNSVYLFIHGEEFMKLKPEAARERVNPRQLPEMPFKPLLIEVFTFGGIKKDANGIGRIGNDKKGAVLQYGNP
jgi:hypothetical protein